MKIHSKFALLFLAVSILISCDNFEYNVYQENVYEKDPEVSSAFNINRLLNTNKKDTLHIVFFGDSQRYYDDLEDLIKEINNLPIVDAVILAGDISDFGVGKEFLWINRQMKNLKAPFLTVIGNHDCLANGTDLYKNIYGDLNYSFTWNDVRFIMHNTNSREFNFDSTVPDLNWMKQQLVDTAAYKSCLFVSHIPPNNVDFDASLEQPYTSIIRHAKNIVMSVNGHNHDKGLYQIYNDGVWYLNTSSPKNRFFSYVAIYPYAESTKKFDNTFIAF